MHKLLKAAFMKLFAPRSLLHVTRIFKKFRATAKDVYSSAVLLYGRNPITKKEE
jgi:hypothetical protein